MKTLSLTLLALIALTPTAFSFGGSGPWADGAYYPGGLNGKYVGIVTGNNISGVLGFAIVEGAPPFRTTEQESGQGDLIGTVAVNTDIRPDILQNYFAIFVEGRTYTGSTLAGIDIDSKSVAGALQGTDPPAILAPIADAGFDTGIVLTNTSIEIIEEQGVFEQPDGTFVNLVTNTLVVPTINLEFTPPIFNNAVSILARGLSGGFTAKVKGKRNVFTFKGDGQLSTPANRQSYTASGFVQQRPFIGEPPGVPVNSLTNMFVTASYETESTPFNIRGIRTSLFANNPTAQQDARVAAPAGGAN